MDAIDSKDKARISAVRSEIKGLTAKTPNPSRPFDPIATPLASTAPSPPRAPHGSGSASVSASEAAELLGSAHLPDNVSLDTFHARFTSEDNQSFEELMERTVAKKQHAYWWAYENDAASKSAALAITNRPHAAEFDDGLKHIEDRTVRPAGPHTWTHRTRNQFMFLPDLDVSRETSGLQRIGAAASNTTELMLHTPTSSDLALSGAAVTDAGGLLPPKIIKHSNTRFTAATAPASPLPELAVPSAPSEASAQGSGYALVRSPSPTPGDANDEPIMTWGDIAATPMILGGGDSSFRSPELPKRDSLAHTLEAKAKSKAKLSNKRSREPSASSSGKAGSLTPLMMAHMTPAAAALAEKMLAGKRGGVFGDASLRASYSGAASPAVGRTPRTPGLAATGYTPIPRGSAAVPSGASMPPPKRPAGLTDGLLKF